MHEITGDIIKHCYSKASYVVLMSFWIFFTYKSVYAARNSATEGLVCSWTIQVLPYYHLVAGRVKMKELSGILLLLAFVAMLQSLMQLYWTTDFLALKSLASFLLYLFFFFPFVKRLFWIITKKRALILSPILRWEFWLRSEKHAQMSSIIMPWSEEKENKSSSALQASI